MAKDVSANMTVFLSDEVAYIYEKGKHVYDRQCSGCEITIPAPRAFARKQEKKRENQSLQYRKLKF